MRLADVLVSDTIRLMQDVPSPLILETLDLHFRNIRHVRITVLDGTGTVVRAMSGRAALSSEHDTPPDWFARLIAPAPDVRVFPLLVRNHRVGEVAINAEPADEIGEAWQYAGAIFVTGFCLNLAVFLLLFVLFTSSPPPLTRGGDGRISAPRQVSPSASAMAR